jgi:hypothetical protein
MDPILPLLACLDPVLAPTRTRQLGRITGALLRIPGRVTMRGLSRWTDEGAASAPSNASSPWASLFWLFFRAHSLAPDDVYVLAGDEVIVTKAGKHTHGLDRFFCSLYGKAVPGVAFFALALVSTRERHAFPVHVAQVVRDPAERTAAPCRARRPPHSDSSIILAIANHRCIAIHAGA